MDRDYWREYYKKNTKPYQPSPFGKYVMDYMKEGKTVLELGCGNARDSYFFFQNNLKVVGIDQVEKQINFLQENYGNEDLNFLAEDFTDIKSIDSKFDYIYSRFTLHSVSRKQENKTLNWSYNHLEEDGVLFIELRSTKDELFQSGDKVEGEKNARITDHYRRFVDFDRLKADIREIGFEIMFDIESNGLAVHKDEDPVVIRIIAKKIKKAA